MHHFEKIISGIAKMCCGGGKQIKIPQLRPIINK